MVIAVGKHSFHETAKLPALREHGKSAAALLGKKLVWSRAICW